MTRAIRSRVVFVALATVVVLAFLALAGFTVTNLASRLQDSNERVASKDAQLGTKDEQIASLLEDVHASQDNAQRLWDQLLALGATPDGEDPQAVAGPAGERGPAGRDATDAQIAESLANWCLTFGCVGEDGRDGNDGQSSTTPGPPGAVGATGPAGADGRGIQSLYCDDITGRWTVTYTDTATADAGVCRTNLLEGVTP